MFIKTFASGMDFLGWVHFPKHLVLRTASKNRMTRNIFKNPTPQAIQSYLGLLSHGDAHGLQEEVVNQYGLLSEK